MSWLDNVEQYIWDIAWDSWLSGEGLIRSSQNYYGTEQDDIIIFSQRLFYRNPYDSIIKTYGGDDIIETVGVPSSSEFYLGEGDDGLISRDQIRYSSIFMGNGDDIFWAKESLWGDSSLLKSIINLGDGNDQILIDKDRSIFDSISGNIDGNIFSENGNDTIIIRGNGLIWKSENYSLNYSDGSTSRSGQISGGSGDDSIGFNFLIEGKAAPYFEGTDIYGSDGNDKLDLSKVDLSLVKDSIASGGNGYDILYLPVGVIETPSWISGFERIYSGSEIILDLPKINISGPSGDAGASTSSISITENGTAVNTFTANETVTWSLNGGADASLFSINSLTGALSFSSEPDYESPGDSDIGNDYIVIVRATSSLENTSDQTLTVTVEDQDEINPSLSSFTPADNATAVEKTSNIVLNFSEAVDVETGNIVIYKASDDSVVEIIDVTSGKVIGSGSTQITINPSSDFAEQTEYYVQIAATAFDDIVGNSYAGISDKTSMNFTTESATKDLGKLNNGIIYSYDNVITGSNQLKYMFSVDGDIYPYFTLSGMSSDLDIDIYEVTTTVSGINDQTLIKSSQNAGIESEYFFKALDTGNYEILIIPYENNTDEKINFNLKIDNKSFEQNTTLPNDPFFKDQWYLFNTGQADAIDNYDIFAPEAWKDTNSSPKITVAVIDSGIDYNHFDLDDNIWINTGEIKNNNIDDDGNGYIDDYQGWDFYYQDNDPMDYISHGTHVAGIIGAEGNNSIGITGISWDIELMNLKVFSDNNTEKGSKNLLPAIRYAADNGADIINLSLSLNLGEATDYIYPSITFEDFKQAFPEVYQSYYDSLKYASDKGITIIASLGNDSTNTEQYTSIPADFSLEIPGMISVAAINNKGDTSYYSNYGNITSIAAPGGAQYFENDPNGILSTVINNQYKYFQGTSMAAPIVAGASALILEKDPTLTPEEVKKKIISGGSSQKNLENIVANGLFLDLDKSLKFVSSTEDISNHSIGNFYNLKGIKDFDGYHHANSGKASDNVKNAYKYQGLLDVNADGIKEAIYTNKESGRWVTASINSSGEIDYSEYGQGGTTRVVGIYIDPLVTSGEVEQSGPHDSQSRFQNDLKIENLIAKTSGDYDGDGFQEVYWKTNDGTAYLRALMHADGNIKYANYQSEDQMSDYLTSKGFESEISNIL